MKPAYHVLALFIFTFGLVGADEYVRPPAGKSVFVSLSDDHSKQTPQQVHISLVGDAKMRISWITDDVTPSTVRFGKVQGEYEGSANGSSSSYGYLLYESGQIHDVVIGPLEQGTIYYYKCGLDSSPELSFRTPPAQYPIDFAVSGTMVFFFFFFEYDSCIYSLNIKLFNLSKAGLTLSKWSINKLTSCNNIFLNGKLYITLEPSMKPGTKNYIEKLYHCFHFKSTIFSLVLSKETKKIQCTLYVLQPNI